LRLTRYKQDSEASGKHEKREMKLCTTSQPSPRVCKKHLIAADRQAFEEKRWHAAGNREVPYEDLVREHQGLEAKERADVAARASLLCDCYVKLIKMGDLSFRTEYDWRQCQRCA
jgi:hypothetical protein